MDLSTQTRYSAALMKLLHYPPQTGPIDERVIGIGAHTEWVSTNAKSIADNVFHTVGRYVIRITRFAA